MVHTNESWAGIDNKSVVGALGLKKPEHLATKHRLVKVDVPAKGAGDNISGRHRRCTTPKLPHVLQPMTTQY